MHGDSENLKKPVAVSRCMHVLMVLGLPENIPSGLILINHRFWEGKTVSFKSSSIRKYTYHLRLNCSKQCEFIVDVRLNSMTQ